jgi:choline dehydrogenase
MTCGVWQQRPESTGFVHARSRDPFEKPQVQPNYLAAEVDRRVLVAGMRLGRDLLRTSSLRLYLDREVAPEDTLQTDDELLDFARRNGTTVYHNWHGSNGSTNRSDSRGRSHTSGTRP